MIKDIEWLKQWIEEYESEVIKVIEKRKDESDGFITTLSRGKQSAIKRIKQKIDQLDEPETHQLKDKIKELDDYNSELIRDNNQLRNELDKQELPVIPKFMADWIEKNRPKYGKNILKIGHDFYEANLDNSEVDNWIENNIETFTRAWLNGYKIETPCSIQYLTNKYENNDNFSLDTSLELDESQFNIYTNGGITLPRFVADFEEEHRGEYFTDIFNSAELWQRNEKVAHWLYGDDMLASQREIILALALNFGYTIEEPLFYVEFIKGVYLVYYPSSENLDVTNDKNTKRGITEFTEEQIKGFDKGDVMFKHYAYLIEDVD